MYLERYGSGPRIFLGLHGWSGDHRTFEALVRNLPEDVSFYAADLPGCGRSDPPARWTVESVTDAIAETVQTSIRGPFTLVGNCSGGLLGMRAAQKLGRQVERMLLIDIFAVFPWYFRIFLVPAFGPLAYYSTFANPLGRWIANAGLRSKRAAETTLTGGFQSASHQNTYRYLELFKNFPRPETFFDLSMPIDIVYGERTFVAVIHSLARWQSVWPQAAVRPLMGAGHLPILEATSQMKEILFQGTREKEGPATRECPTAASTIAN